MLSQSHWQIQGALLARPPPPQQDPFLLFLHTFSPKSVHVGGWRPPPPTGRRPPPHQRKILDPPLNLLMICGPQQNLMSYLFVSS